MNYKYNVGINWHLKFRLIIEDLRDQLEDQSAYIRQLEKKVKKYENNNTRTTRNGQDNNVVKLSGRVHTAGDKT